jgi:hypothetical protein
MSIRCSKRQTKKQRPPKCDLPIGFFYSLVSLHMSSHKLFTTLALFSVACGAAQACVCETDVASDQISKWIEDRTAAAAYVFLARITEVKTSGRIPALDTIVKVQTLEKIKGAPQFTSLTTSECQNFDPAENDTRVLFVTAEGMICGCTDYRRFINDAKLLTILRAGVGKNAN